MNLKEIIELPNQIAIPLLIHRAKSAGYKRSKRVDNFFISYEPLRHLIITYSRPTEFMFELTYDEELSSSILLLIFSGEIQYSKHREIYDSEDLDNNQLILTFGKDPFTLKKK